MEGRELPSFQRLRKDVYADLGKFKAGGKTMLWVAVWQRLGWWQVSERAGFLRRELVKRLGLEGRRRQAGTF